MMLKPSDISRLALESLGIGQLFRGQEYTEAFFDEAAVLKGLGVYQFKPLSLREADLNDISEIYQSAESEAFYGRIKEASNPPWLAGDWFTIDERTPWRPFSEAPPVPHVMGLDPEVIDQDAYAAFMKSL